KSSGKDSSEDKADVKPSDSKGKLSYLEQKEHKNLEKDIQKLEKKKTEAQQKFADPELSGEDIDKLSIELQEVLDAIDAKTERWFELSAMLEG
ncbi:MAG TPA: ABC transporter C-terminal domain-containing protein, partial [Pricia sp.]|nr:ABC transporter C-terminal domain-containing protein [Pricia sp.]